MVVAPVLALVEDVEVVVVVVEEVTVKVEEPVT